MLFVVWSLTGFVLEVPSGAWADVVDRRHLLVLAAALQAAGFACWTLAPTHAGFAAGFVLWGVSGALASGTEESLLYDELRERRAAGAFAWLLGRSHAAAMTANLLATVAAAPLLALGGYPLVGWVSVAVSLGHLTLAATLPVSLAARRNRVAGPTGTHEVAVATERGVLRYVAMLRSGLREASGSLGVRRAALIAAAVVGASAYDEYFPLVARENGAPAEQVPWLLGVVVLGQVVGTTLAGRTGAMTGRTMGWVLLGAAVAVSAGALVAPWPGFAAVALGYGLLNNAMIVSQARLQDLVAGRARATVTSAVGLATEVVALTVYLGFAATAGAVDVPLQVAALGMPLALLAVLVRRRLPPWSPPRSAPGEGV